MRQTAGEAALSHHMQRLLNKARDAVFYPNEKPRFAKLALQSSHLTARVTAKPSGHPRASQGTTRREGLGSCNTHLLSRAFPYLSFSCSLKEYFFQLILQSQLSDSSQKSHHTHALEMTASSLLHLSNFLSTKLATVLLRKRTRTS